MLSGMILQAEQANRADKMRIGLGRAGSQIGAIQEYVYARRAAPLGTDVPDQRKDASRQCVLLHGWSRDRCWAGTVDRRRSGRRFPEDVVWISSRSPDQVVWIDSLVRPPHRRRFAKPQCRARCN